MRKECQQKIATSAFTNLLNDAYCPNQHTGVYKSKKTNKHYFRSAREPCSVHNAAFLQLINWDTTSKATIANQESASCSSWRWMHSLGFASV